MPAPTRSRNNRRGRLLAADLLGKLGAADDDVDLGRAAATHRDRDARAHFTPQQLEFGTGGPPMAERLVSLSTLKNEFEGLEFLVHQETEREILEGRMHTGWASVVQVVGERV